MIPAGTHVTVITRGPKHSKRAWAGELTHDYQEGGNAHISRDADSEWSGFGPRPTGKVTVTIDAKRIKRVAS